MHRVDRQHAPVAKLLALLASAQRRGADARELEASLKVAQVREDAAIRPSMERLAVLREALHLVATGVVSAQVWAPPAAMAGTAPTASFARCLQGALPVPSPS